MNKVTRPELMVLKSKLWKSLEAISEKSIEELLEESGLDRFLLYIEDERLRQLTTKALAEAELNFWVSPSSLYHHSPDERTIGGLVMHTNRVCMLGLDLADIYNIEMGSEELQHIVMACLFHDICKGSIHSTQFEWSPDGRLNVDHPYIGSEFLRDLGIPEEVADAVRWHHGKWGEEYKEKPIEEYSRLELIVHMADKLASTDDLTLLRGWKHV